MTKQVRDWNKDMDHLKRERVLYELMSRRTDELDIGIHWLQEAEKWRLEAFRQYPTPEAYDAACAALHKHRERADAAEAREKKLRDEYKFLWERATAAADREMKLIEYIKDQGDEGKRFLEFLYGQIPTRTEPVSLYPKEEEAK